MLFNIPLRYPSQKHHKIWYKIYIALTQCGHLHFSTIKTPVHICFVPISTFTNAILKHEGTHHHYHNLQWLIIKSAHLCLLAQAPLNLWGKGRERSWQALDHSGWHWPIMLPCSSNIIFHKSSPFLSGALKPLPLSILNQPFSLLRPWYW